MGRQREADSGAPRVGPAGPPVGRRSGIARAALRGMRLALITALVWVSWCTALTFSALLSGPRAVARPEVAVPEAPQDPAAAFDALRAGGAWSFAGFPYSIAIAPAEGGGLTAQLVAQTRPESAASESDLLPLPDSAHRLGCHWDGAGRMIAELISVDGPRSMLLTSWARQGWTARGAPGGRPDGPRLLSRGNNQFVYVWFHDTAEAGPPTLLLVRPPAPAPRGRTP
jgi:hypothetical protein